MWRRRATASSGASLPRRTSSNNLRMDSAFRAPSARGGLPAWTLHYHLREETLTLWSSELGGDQVVVGEDDIAAIKLGSIGRFEPFHRIRLAVCLVRCFILEDEEVHESRGVVFLLPSQVHASAGF